MGSLFKLTSTKNNQIEKFKLQAVKELNKFYKKNWHSDSFKIILLEDRNIINEWHGTKTKEWIAGWSLSTNVLLILSPDNFATESSHSYSDEAYFKFLKHELSHLYFETIYGSSEFPWINEGIPVYSANQIEGQNAPKKFKGFLDNEDLYWESGYAVKSLVDNFGKEKLFWFLESQSGVKNLTKLNTAFTKVYGKTLNYDFFNELK